MKIRGNVLVFFFTTQIFLSHEVCRDFATERGKVVPTSNKKYFGNSIALSDNYLAVGSKFDNENGLTSGAVHVYTRVGDAWRFLSKLIPPKGVAHMEFGACVALTTSTLAVGSPRDNVHGLDSGAVYLYELHNGTWTGVQRIAPIDDGSNSGVRFGTHLDISNVTLVASSNSNGGNLAYVFQRTSNSWEQVKKLKITDDRVFPSYDHPVAVDGNQVVIGRWYDNKNGHQSGSAVVFTKSGHDWVEDAKLLPSDGSNSDWFGISVVISGDYVVISSHGDDIKGADGSGSAYVFTKSKGRWIETVKLVPSQSKSGNSFGYPVAINNGVIIIGCTGYDSTPPNHNSGAVYVFQNVLGNWTEQYKVLPSDGEYNGMFGYSLAINDENIVVASRKYDDKTGSVYLFDNLDVAGNSSLLCEPEIPLEEGVSYVMIVAIVVPLIVLLVTVIVIAVCKTKRKEAPEKGEEEAEFIYQDMPNKSAQSDESGRESYVDVGVNESAS